MDKTTKIHLDHKMTVTEPLYMQIDKALADRIRIYLTECKNLDIKKITSKKVLIEEAVHEFILNHPTHELTHENAN